MTTNNSNDETQFGGGGGDATQVGGSPPATPEEPNDNRKLWLIALAVLLIGVLIGVGVAVAGGGDDDKKQAGDNTSTSSSSTSSSSSSTTSTTSGSTTSPTNAPTNDDPRIDSYSANPGTITCPDMTTSVSFTLSWATTNTNQVVLSVDGAGAYNTYNSSSGSEVLTPACPAPGTSAQHTYTITAKGPNGPDAVRTITYSLNTIP
jgi:cytoskeletal protein RodZ